MYVAKFSFELFSRSSEELFFFFFFFFFHLRLFDGIYFQYSQVFVILLFFNDSDSFMILKFYSFWHMAHMQNPIPISLLYILNICISDIKPFFFHLGNHHSLGIFHTGVSWLNFNGIWSTASLFSSTRLFSVFQPISAVVWMVSILPLNSNSSEPFFLSV